ncbi:4-alpha-glucanotransferase [Bifidobacterium cuniculi]|uniref:4-alpha-glucanotransferase n=1 Tax=Bifidobacterium cuniculi TaxID=1688 RepID=A0A087AYC4_9BIFI|nr:4-alpha-glucanotransferase [Bifidobacterium cuniculi]KFI63774.1 4-alpha-glucanotransferase [Bifidobacterium cuniculi]
MTEHNEESPERLARPLIRLAQMVGVATSYTGLSHDFHEISDEVLVAILASLGIDASGDEAVAASLATVERGQLLRLIDPTVLHVQGRETHVTLHIGITDAPTVTLTLEDGTEYGGQLVVNPLPEVKPREVDGIFIAEAQLVLPDDIPVGYHTLHVVNGDRTQDATLISAPERIQMLDSMQDGALWGWMAQLYSIRSADSWGVGDFSDLRELLVNGKRYTDADFVLVNPLHAAEPVDPLTPSPYLPVSRRFVNFTYIRPEDVPEYNTLGAEDQAKIKAMRAKVEAFNADPQLIDRDAMWLEKKPALRIIFDAGLSEERQKEFDAYKEACGEDLEAYATWCLCYQQWGKPEPDPENWEVKLTKDSPEVTRLRGEYQLDLEFYRWLEWTAMQQLHAAQQAAKTAGMKLGIMSDMAVGVHPQGSEVWWNPERFAKGATVGAPPDMFNQQGQNWSQPPLSPLALKETGYLSYREMVRGMFDCAGAVRIDHILGLFRLWWIPDGHPASDGTYVYYDHNVMLGILAIEASRVNGIVVGEDLGVVPSYVQESLGSHGILGCAVEWFEQMDGVFTPPKHWRPYALASVNTHDLPPAAGYLEYEHVKIRERLGLLTEGADEFMQSARVEHQAMLQMLVDEGYLDPEVLADEANREDEVVEALYRGLKGSPCKLLAASLVDAVGEKRAQNQPGTNNEYPNWRIPLADGNGNAVMLEDLFQEDLLQRITKIMNA